MTNDLQELLKHYGLLTVTLKELVRERPGTRHESLDKYYEELGAPLPDEPILVVRISKDGELHFLREGEHNVCLSQEEGGKSGAVTVWELPEDEYWFFQAFRPGLFDLDGDLPRFVYEMAIIHAYAMFEAYLSSLLRMRLCRHPQLMGGQRQIKYDQVFEAATKADLIESMIERDVRDLMYLPLVGLIETMREKLGFRALTNKHDDSANQLALVRNCLVHNGRRVDAKLAKANPILVENEELSLSMSDVDDAVTTLRKFAYEIDKSFEDLS